MHYAVDQTLFRVHVTFINSHYVKPVININYCVQYILF